MITKQKTPVQKVLLRQRVIVKDGLVFDAEREVTLFIQPFVGLWLYNILWHPPGSEESDEPIKEMAYDLKTGRVICYLPLDDYRPESSGCEWTEADVRQYYQDWTLTRDKTCRAATNRKKNK
jgi:hypothetical protein